MPYSHNHNAIFICLALYIMTLTFVLLNVLVYFTNITLDFILIGAGYFGITKLISLTDSKRE